jgi:hypothetical protein
VTTTSTHAPPDPARVVVTEANGREVIGDQMTLKQFERFVAVVASTTYATIGNGEMALLMPILGHVDSNARRGPGPHRVGPCTYRLVPDVTTGAAR